MQRVAHRAGLPESRTVIGSAALAGIADKITPLQSVAGMMRTEPAMPTRPLGRTGYDVGIFSIGGQATLEKLWRADDSIAIVNRAIDLGVNYIDTAAAYGDGVSEKYIGEVLKTRRGEVYLASKTMERGYDDSMRLLERSLKNLQTDHLDLWQLHNVRTQDDLDRIFGAHGALKALEKARDEKMVRFLGITGHRDPFVLRKGIEQYPFDSTGTPCARSSRSTASIPTPCRTPVPTRCAWANGGPLEIE